MPPKRPRLREQDAPQPKRQRVSEPTSSSSSYSSSRRTQAPTALVPRTGADLLSPVSDELLVRILSYLSLPHLLALAPVSRRFHRLAEDSQLWKALYYARFVLPRAMRIPGFRDGGMDAARMRDRKLHYKGRRTLWADGRLGGLVREAEGEKAEGGRRRGLRNELPGADVEVREKDGRVDWKRQYKIRHNWARGKCAVEELKLGPDPQDDRDIPETDDEEDRSKMLVKVVEGLAITVDRVCGLRAWDLKTRDVMAQLDLYDRTRQDEDSPPSCLAIDDSNLEKGSLDISVGFTDGSFGVWRLHLPEKNIVRRYRHEKSSNGELMGLSYSHPYLLTATGAVLLSLYTFEVPEKLEDDAGDEENAAGSPPSPVTDDRSEDIHETTTKDEISLPPPYLVTSLRSHTSDPPLALSIRKTASSTVASIAYTFFTRTGWSIGIQDLHITPNDNPKRAPNITTRLAYTTPFRTSGTSSQIPSPPRTPSRPRIAAPGAQEIATSLSTPVATPTIDCHPNGPTTLCYTHPYLLATLPDNTLVLHLCTSSAAALSVSPGIRLWGHTSGISDAEITARGKAVSVSSRGEEMRVWELEGRPSAVRSSCRSVEIRPGGSGPQGDGRDEKVAVGAAVGDAVDWEERRNWVGFDDEVVIVLKEARGGRESLLVYDFT